MSRRLAPTRTKAPEVAGADREHDERGGDDQPRGLVETEVVESQRNADEFGHDGQGVQHKKIDNAERAPELAEALEDEARVADAGDRAEAQHHLLIDIKNRDQQRQSPQERRAVVLASLPVSGESARVVVSDHDDEAGAEDRHERDETMLPGFARSDIAMLDGAERAVDVADVGLVEDGGSSVLGVNTNSHDLPPCRTGAGGEPSPQLSALLCSDAAI
jgi:hypothetical protein